PPPPPPPPDAVNATMVQFPNGSAQIIAYQARPKTGSGPFPAVIVIHENMGLTDHIKDVTRRLAKEGFVGLGVDFLSRSGGTMAFNTPQDVTAAINKLTDEQIISDVSAAITYLTGSGVGAPKVGVVGFCWGGRRSLLAAENDKGLSAAVVYYGPITPPDSVQTDDTLADAAKDMCPVLGNFGALDPIIPAAKIQQLQQALQSAGKTVDFKIYPDAGHAFNNDTRPFTNGVGYVADAAQDAWGRTLAWYRKYLV
ncbi:MAG: dienelactone hydrolase family protein, partial [Thermomicrobiales bacterium]